MSRILCFLVFLPLFALGQKYKPTFNLTADSLAKHPIQYLNELNWKFAAADDSIMASPDHDDSKWIVVDPNFRGSEAADSIGRKFTTVGWFRFHFTADTSVINIPLALNITHYGASEIYLDGKKIMSYGAIKGAGNSTYYDPATEPFALVIHNTGAHLLAIRYANYDAAKNYRLFKVSFTGFKIFIGKADSIALNNIESISSYSFFPTLLFALFITLSVLHFLLYIYYPAASSNLYFSIFCLCLSLVFLIFYSTRTSSDPNAVKFEFYGTFILCAMLCFSLSGISNGLFSSKRLRFRIIALFCVVAIILAFVNSDAGALLLLICAVVLVEAIALTIQAIRKKVKGARIVGAGILFFSIFILFFLITAIIKRGLTFHQGLQAEIFLYSAFCAVLSIPVSMSVYLSWQFAGINSDLKKQLTEVEKLSLKNLQQEQEKKQILEQQKDELEREVAVRTDEVVKQKREIEQQHDELKAEKKKSDDLLLNILPAEVAEELKQNGFSKARYFDEVTVLFTDFVDFTNAAERMGPEELVAELDTCFKEFDHIISRYNIEKIKTIGDAYLAVCGLPEPIPDHAVRISRAALDILAFIEDRKRKLGGHTFEIRIGIHTGSVVAGIVGVKKFAYDIWGDTVNTAARMEQNSLPGKINISQATFEMVKDSFKCSHRGVINAKNKGELTMYFLDGAV